MKIAIGYPPLVTSRGVPQISQNRQFQWTVSGPIAYFIYPVIPASAATLLASKDRAVFWLDGLAKKQSFREWLEELEGISPDVLAIETKTPVVKRHWQIVAHLKTNFPTMRIVLMGDHVTALPKESMESCPVDFAITGGDYDFLLLSIVDFLTGEGRLEPGIWYRKKIGDSKYEIRNTGKFRLNHDLNTLPMIDRDLTQWRRYAFKNSNFYRAPGAYTMFGRDCWWGRCTFCSWTTIFPGKCFRVIKVEKALDEIGLLIDKYKVKEIMDDSGTFPVGEWLKTFCRGMIKRGYHKKIKLNCNLRFNAGLSAQDYQLMGKAGFRFILYGLESASQKTLDMINKNLRVDQIEPVLRWAKSAGLMPHLTVMVGYPWENEEDLGRTIQLAENLFRRGLADSLQATIVIPYPGTPLFDYCQQRGLLKTTDWDRYDMTETIMKTKISEEKLASAVRNLYSRSIWTLPFMLKTISQLRSWDGIKYVSFQAMKYFGKLMEFKNQ